MTQSSKPAAQVAQALKAFALTLKQKLIRRLLGGPETHCLVYGGSRSGKTFLLVFAIAMRALRAPGSRHLIARKATKHVKASVFLDTFPKVMALAFPGVPWEENKSDLYVTLPGGSTIWFGGLDDKERVEKILGQEYATIYVNECSQLSYDAVIMLRSRLAQNVMCTDGRQLKLKAYYDLNPVGKSHWTYKEFVAGVNPKTGQPLSEGERCFATINPDENPHLPEQYHKILADMPERQRQRFKEGKFINEVPGALWKLDTLETYRIEDPPVDMQRVVIGVDPMVAKVEDGEAWDLGECGIVAAGLGVDGRGYVLADGSERLSPDGWARKAIALYHAHRADLIAAEKNNGGEMVRLTINMADETGLVPISLVSASRGKITRAEPISALYEQGKVSHCGFFPELEDQMTSYTGAPGEISPDRMDALVWALTALFMGVQIEPFISFAKVMAARKRSEFGAGPVVIGVKPLGAGRQGVAIIDRQGRRAGERLCEHWPDAEKLLVSKLVRMIQAYRPARVFIEIAEGKGLYDRLCALGYGPTGADVVAAVNFQADPVGAGPLPSSRYLSREAECWDAMRTWFEDPAGVQCPDSDELHKHVCTPVWGKSETGYDGENRLKMETLDHAEARCGTSAQLGGAFALTFAEPVFGEEDGGDDDDRYHRADDGRDPISGY